MAENSAGDFTVGKIRKNRGQRVAKIYGQQKRNIIHTSSTAYEQDHSAAAPPTSVMNEVMFNSLPASIEYIKAGTLRALAVASATRSETLPSIPTMGEFLPGFEASQWYGVGAPKNTPPQIIDKLNKEINAGLANPKFKAQLARSNPLAGQRKSS